MKKLFLPLIILCLFINTISSQNGFVDSTNGKNVIDYLMVSGFISSPATEHNTNVLGSQYITEGFVSAKISIIENKIYPGKYNAFLDQIEIMSKDGTVYVMDKDGRKDIAITFIDTKKTYQLFNYLDKKNKNNLGYFISMNNRDLNVLLLKRERIKFVKERKAKTSYDKNKLAEYKKLEDIYYIKIKDKPAVLVANNKTKLIKLFPEHKNKISAFVKTEKLNMNNETDIIKLINYINKI